MTAGKTALSFGDGPTGEQVAMHVTGEREVIIRVNQAREPNMKVKLTSLTGQLGVGRSLLGNLCGAPPTQVGPNVGGDMVLDRITEKYQKQFE
jgi:hypothetical protein